MKKLFTVLVLIAFCFSVFAGGSTESATSQTDSSKPVDLMFISMASTTAIYTYSTTMANLLLDVLPQGSTIDVPETSPGGLTAQYSVVNGETDLVVMNGVSVTWSMENPDGVMGLGQIKEGVSSLVNGLDMPHVATIITESFIKKTGCSSLEEIVANKIPANFYIKKKGNLGENAFTQLLECLGTTEEELISWGCTVNRDTAGNIATAFQDGRADITVDHLPNGQAATVQLTTNVECRVVGLSEAVADKMAEKGWTKTVWTAGSSKFVGHNEDLLTVGAPNCLICSSDLDEDLAYLITKTICENSDKLVSASAALSVFDPTQACGILTDILHPGAERYYREMGYLK